MESTTASPGGGESRPRRHLILGAGPAGVTAAETLRRHDPDAEITLVHGEAGLPYARMAIPYVLAGRTDEEGTRIRHDPEHYRRLNIDLLSGKIEDIDVAARWARFTDGRAVSYDRLLIATGSRPVREDIPGMHLPGVHTCWTLADLRSLMATIKPGTRVVQMGAGFVGCVIMEGLVSRGAELTVLVRSGLMVSRMIHPTAGDLIRRWCETKGVRILTKTQTARIAAGRRSRLAVTLSDGETLPADVYLSAVGVRPNIGFLAHSGIAVDQGILVDEHMQTSLPGVYAAGDVAEAADGVTGLRHLNAIQPNAVEQGRIAALNMAGVDVASKGSLAFNVLDTLGLVSASFGQWQGVPGGDSAEMLDERDFRYLRLEFSGDHLVGANAVGITEHLGALRGLIERKVRLGRWKQRLMENPSQHMAAYVATTRRAA